MPLIKERECRHDSGFRFLRLDNSLASDRMYKAPGAWVCAHGCGYRLNFNPEHYEFGVAYLDKPNEKQSKELNQTLSTGKG